MLAFTDDLLKAGLESDPAAEKLLGQATSRSFLSCKKCASTPSQSTPSAARSNRSSTTWTPGSLR
jgi:hypothetical protein